MKMFERFSGREKALILGALPLVLLFAGYRFGWAPLADARMNATADIVGYRTLIEAAETAGQVPTRARTVDVPTAPLANRITRSAEEAGVLVRRLEPEGELIRVTLDDAPFDDVIGWIAAMEAQEAISLLSIEMDRRTAPGIVSARLALENAR